MKVLIALLLVAGAFAHIQMSEIHDIWTTWKATHSKSYADAKTEAHRLAVFIETFVYIQEWNAAGNTAVLGLNQFSDLTSEEFGALYTGALPAPEEVVQANLADFSGFQAPPAEWDWRTKGAVTAIKNQGQCGSCWAFATVATCEGLWFINGHTLTSYSEQQIVDCDNTNYGCNGGYPYLAMQYVAKEGLETESDYPYKAVQGTCEYDASKATKGIDTGSKFVTAANVADLETAVVQQPVAVLVQANQAVFQSYSSGVITSGCGTALDHAITVVGYGTYANQGAWFVKNSWGATWGVQGYVYISNDASYNSGYGSCGILTQPQFPTGISS